jgi:hypothetical protein
VTRGVSPAEKCWTMLPYSDSPDVFRSKMTLRRAQLLKERNWH